MRPATTLGAFALGLGVVFAGAAGVGQAVGPVGGTTATATHAETGTHAETETQAGTAESATHADSGTHAGSGTVTAGQPEGLSSSLDGYVLRLDTPSLPQGTGTLAFHVLGEDGAPVTSYTPTHERDLHLVVVRRDGSGFQHLHPERDASGRWTVPLTLPEAGAYKVVVDTAPGGRIEALALAADLQVAGDYRPRPLPADSRTAQVDGYQVALAGDLVAGTQSPLVLTVTRDGRPVTDLQPYLGAYGHLVSLRDGDLAYLHTHPEDGPPGPQVRVGVDVPTAGRYLLHLDFRHGDVVRTATFTATAEEAS